MWPQQPTVALALSFGFLSKQPDQASVPTVPPGKIIEDSLKDLTLPGGVAGAGLMRRDWQARILWSWDDMGPLEAAVQREVAKLDEKYTSNAYSACVWPGSGLASRVGRACVMQSYACYAARTKLDERALDLTAAPNCSMLPRLNRSAARERLLLGISCERLSFVNS